MKRFQREESNSESPKKKIAFIREEEATMDKDILLRTVKEIEAFCIRNFARMTLSE